VGRTGTYSLKLALNQQAKKAENEKVAVP